MRSVEWVPTRLLSGVAAPGRIKLFEGVVANPEESAGQSPRRKKAVANVRAVTASKAHRVGAAVQEKITVLGH
ncbi:hypothetical protein BGX21_005066 [Mortierella sp. AD011]|nr:hypothetical protein BGX21_005066 [Mortierella sp. AD011]